MARITFEELLEHAKLNPQTKDISYKGEVVALFYFRDGYAP